MFEVEMDADLVALRGTVSDAIGTPLADTPVTVKVGEKTVEAATNSAGVYQITEGLEAGEATISAAGKEVKVTLEAGKMNIGDITIDLAPMPDAYATTILESNFDSQPKDAFQFDKGSAVENGNLVITKGMGNNSAAVAKFSPQVSKQKGVDFSFDWKCDKKNKMGFEFRDSYDRLLFAVCAAPNSGQLRTSTEGIAVDSAKAAADGIGAEPKWTPVALDTNKTYTFRVHADFTKKLVSFRVSEKDGEVVAQKLNVPVDAVNLAKMNACSWWDSGAQYIDNFAMTAPEEAELPLNGKSVYAFGDSIVNGHTYDKASFINYVADQEGMNVQKYAVNGATIMDANYSGGQILKQLDKATGGAPDYVIFDGGTNDAEYLAKNTNISLGQVTDSQDSALDTNTFAGAFEQTIADMKSKWPNAQIIYTAVHKMGSRETDMQEKLRAIYLAACEKYGVIVADVYTSELDTTDVNKKNNYTFDGNANTGLPGINGSGTHPNLAAIEEYYAPIVARAFGVKEQPEKVDKTELQAYYDEHKDKTGEAYTEESFATFTAALANAKTVLENEEATQIQVTAALTGLKSAVATLKEKDPEPAIADKTALQKLYDENQGKAEADYTEESFAAFTEALTTAKSVLERAEATQEEVDTAAAALESAVNALKEKDPEPAIADKTALQKLYDENQGKAEADYTKESFAVFTEALTTAKSVLEKAEATQEEVDTAAAALAAAVEGLKKNEPEPPVPEKTLTSIRITEVPVKTEYIKGETLDTAGLAVEAVYSDGSAAQITDGIEISGYDANKPGEQTVTVTYQGQTTTFSVMVKTAANLEAGIGDGEESIAVTIPPESIPDGAVLDEETGNPTNIGLKVSKAETGEEINQMFIHIEEMIRESLGTAETVVDEQNTSVFDIKLVNTDNDQEVQPKGEVLVVIPKPEGYSNNLKLFHNHLNGLREIGFKWRNESELEFRTDSFSFFTLVDLGETDKSELERTLAAAGTLNQADYTAASWEAFENALNGAKAVYENPHASQTQIDDAVMALNGAMDALEKNPEPVQVDKSALAAAIERAESLNQTDYTAASWEVMAASLGTAKAVNTDENATQEQVNEATAALNAAIGALEKNLAPEPVTVDKSALERGLNAAKVFDQADYTKESWEAFTKVLNEATAVYADENATQGQVDAASAALEEAVKNLKKKDTKPAGEGGAQGGSQTSGNQTSGGNQNNGTGSAGNVKAAPRTGDESSLILWAGIAMAAFAVIAVSSSRRRSKR